MGFQDVSQVLNVFSKMFPVGPHFVPYALPKLSSSKVFIGGQMFLWWARKHFTLCTYLSLNYLDDGGSQVQILKKNNELFWLACHTKTKKTETLEAPQNRSF